MSVRRINHANAAIIDNAKSFFKLSKNDEIIEEINLNVKDDTNTKPSDEWDPKKRCLKYSKDVDTRKITDLITKTDLAFKHLMRLEDDKIPSWMDLSNVLINLFMLRSIIKHLIFEERTGSKEDRILKTVLNKKIDDLDDINDEINLIRELEEKSYTSYLNDSLGISVDTISKLKLKLGDNITSVNPLGYFRYIIKNSNLLIDDMFEARLVLRELSDILLERYSQKDFLNLLMFTISTNYAVQNINLKEKNTKNKIVSIMDMVTRSGLVKNDPNLRRILYDQAIEAMNKKIQESKSEYETLWYKQLKARYGLLVASYSNPKTYNYYYKMFFPKKKFYNSMQKLNNKLVGDRTRGVDGLFDSIEQNKALLKMLSVAMSSTTNKVIKTISESKIKENIKSVKKEKGKKLVLAGVNLSMAALMVAEFGYDVITLNPFGVALKIVKSTADKADKEIRNNVLKECFETFYLLFKEYKIILIQHMVFFTVLKEYIPDLITTEHEGESLIILSKTHDEISKYFDKGIKELKSQTEEFMKNNVRDVKDYVEKVKEMPKDEQEYDKLVEKFSIN